MLKLFLFLLLFRLLNSFLIKSYFHPDEYWQSLEVAHHYVFGIGHLTWEWKEAIRGFAHPWLFSCVYQLTRLLNLDNTEFLLIAPNMLQAVFAALTDIYTWLLAFKLFGRHVAKWALVCSLTSWFNLGVSTRTFSNCIETCFTVMALYYWPKNDKGLWKALLLAGIGCLLRPTSVLLWLFVGTCYILQQKLKIIPKIIGQVLFIGLMLLAVSLWIDYQYYQRLVFVPWNFIKWNVINNISWFYGTNSWHWYFTQGLPTVLFTHLPFAVHGWYYGLIDKESRRKDNRLAWLGLWLMTVYSMFGHKEFRFIMPLLPFGLIYAAISLHSLHIKSRVKLNVALGFLILTNSGLACYISYFHQRGVVDVAKWIRSEAFANRLESVVFLMPCHSTPYYSTVHKNISMRFISCEPPINVPKGYKSEDDLFYEDPLMFINTYFNHDSKFKQVPGQTYKIHTYQWPSHLVFFETLLPVVNQTLSVKGYHECQRFFNSHISEDPRRVGDVVVYC